MKNILVIESSPRGQAAFSHQLTQGVVDRLKAKHPEAAVKIYDLSKNPQPHLDESHLAAFAVPSEKLTAAEQLVVRNSQNAIADLKNADAIVIGVPMYNFSIPSALKAWIDQVARAGHTFSYATGAPEGLVKGKKVYLAIATGGVYSEGPMKAYDFTEPYLKAVLGFLGMTDVTTYRVEGVMIPGVKETALEKALASIRV